MLQPHAAAPQPGAAPVLHYCRAFFRRQLGQVWSGSGPSADVLLSRVLR